MHLAAKQIIPKIKPVSINLLGHAARRSLGTAGNTITPHSLTITNGAGVIIPVLQHYIDSNDGSKNPTLLHLIVPQSGLSSPDANPLLQQKFNQSAADNPLRMQRFGQSTAHLVCRDALQELGYALEERPTMADKDRAVKQTIEQKMALLKEKHPHMTVKLCYLRDNESVRYDRQHGLYVTSPLTGLRESFPLPAHQNGHVIIDGSRQYGKFINRELTIFSDDINSQVREKTSSLFDLYHCSKDELINRLRNATAEGDRVPILGSGLTALWLLPVIAQEGFTPIIINTDGNPVKYCDLMSHANSWIKDKLCEIFQCDEVTLERKLQDWTVNAREMADPHIIRVDNQSIRVNELFDCTGYCFNKGYLEDIPEHMIINPYLPARITFDYLSTVREQAVSALDTIPVRADANVIEIILNTINSVSALKGLDGAQVPPKKIYALMPNLRDIDVAIEYVHTESFPHKEHILSALLTKRVLLILEQLAHNDQILYHPQYQNSDDIGQRSLKALAESQTLFSELCSMARSNNTLKIFELLKKDINLSSLDGRYYNLYAHAPAGSAVMISRMTNQLLAKNQEFSLFDGLTASSQTAELAEKICAINQFEQRGVSAQHLQQIIERALRTFMADPDLFVFTKETIHFKYSAQETIERFYQHIFEKATPVEQTLLSDYKNDVLDVIIRAHLNDLPLDDKRQRHSLGH